MPFCIECGSYIGDDYCFCPECGATVQEQIDGEKINEVVTHVQHLSGIWKNKWIALLLCVFLGWMGAHKYYESKIVMGVIYTCTFAFLGVGWLIDIIRLLFKSNPYLAKR